MPAADPDPVVRIRHNECPVQTKPASKNFKPAIQESAHIPVINPYTNPKRRRTSD